MFAGKALVNWDVICLTETQLVPNQNNDSINQVSYKFSIVFNSNLHVLTKENLEVALCDTESAETLNFVNLENISIFTIRKIIFKADIITFTLVCKENAIPPVTNFDDISQIIANNSIDFIMRDFNIDVFGVQHMLWLLINPLMLEDLY